MKLKNILILFVLLDLVFVGTVLKISLTHERQIASLGDTELTDGQLQKLEIINSFKLTQSTNEISLNTNMLQSLCASYTLIELKFKARDVAFSGQEPTISHVFSCKELSGDSELESFVTEVADFRALQKNHSIKKTASQLSSKALFSDEEFPKSWELFELNFSGESNFTINEAELKKILGNDFLSFQM